MRRGLPLLIGAAGLVGLGLACAAATRYRVLTFFFDGVPEPGAGPRAPVGPYGQPLRATAGGDGRRRVVQQPESVHPPYASDRCDGCHNPFSGQLVRPVNEGLCAVCHADPPGDVVFVHGPVAVNACLECHEPHSSIHRKLLVDAEPAVCLQCHQRADMSVGLHHAELSEDGCTICHDPHGGNQRFFLLQGEP